MSLFRPNLGNVSGSPQGLFRIPWGNKPSGGGGASDPDAVAFLTATGITDPTISAAVNQFVVSLKAASLWTKTFALYLFVGGTADTHKYNLKDPQDTDGAFRITWNGIVTHDANGITGDGVSGYGNTHLTGANLTNNNAHISVYSRTDSANNSWEMSAEDGTRFATLRMRTATGSSQFSIMGGANVNFANSLGHGLGSRTASSSLEQYRNGVSIVTSVTENAVDITLLSQPFFILARNTSGIPVSFSARNLAFASIGLGLDDTEAANFYTAVQAFQTSLGRQV